MYYCNDCGEYMALPCMGETGADACLFCRSEDIEVAGTCGACRKSIGSGADYCTDCMAKAATQIGKLSELLETDRAIAKDLLYAAMERED